MESGGSQIWMQAHTKSNSAKPAHPPPWLIHPSPSSTEPPHINVDTWRSSSHGYSQHSEKPVGPKPPTKLRLEEKGANGEGVQVSVRNSPAVWQEDLGQASGPGCEGRLQQWQVYF